MNVALPSGMPSTLNPLEAASDGIFDKIGNAWTSAGASNIKHLARLSFRLDRSPKDSISDRRGNREGCRHPSKTARRRQDPAACAIRDGWQAQSKAAHTGLLAEHHFVRLSDSIAHKESLPQK